MKKILNRSFFERDTIVVAPELLGKEIVFRTPKDKVKAGLIVEVEAYTDNDPACHANKGKTKRNEPMFNHGGFSYIYFIYGMYFCLNFVTEKKGIPGAVLIRALEIPDNSDKRIASGPGKLCRFLNLNLSQNNIDCCNEDSPLIILNKKMKKSLSIVQTKRIGITQATERPWRWYVKDNGSISKA